MPVLDPATTALVLIDLQNGIVKGDKGPRSGAQVVATAKQLAERFRAAGAPVVLTRVGFRDAAELPSRSVDKPTMPEGATPAAFYEFVDGLRQEGDIAILKHHWGAFIGTDLDLQLRRRKVRTLVIGGIATNMGVESTARSAWELSYDVVVVEDATTSRSAELHRFPVENIFPQISRVMQARSVELSAPSANQALQGTSGLGGQLL
jgi:nicotinamidase-related amidase